MNTELILRHASTQEEKLLGRRLIDLSEQCDRTGWFVSTSFLSPSEREFCRLALPHLGCEAIFDGGFDGAERTCALLYPAYIDAPERYFDDFPIAAIKMEHSTPLTHRDFLGSVLGLGLKRETIGDILVGERESIMLVTRSVLPFLLTSFGKAGRGGVQVSEMALEDIIPPEPKFEIMKDTVASLRIDSVLSVGFRISRETAQDAIRRGIVQLNHREILSTSKILSEGDVLSLRGRGKAILAEVGNESRKGRIWIQVKKYI